MPPVSVESRVAYDRHFKFCIDSHAPCSKQCVFVNCIRPRSDTSAFAAYSGESAILGFQVSDTCYEHNDRYFYCDGGGLSNGSWLGDLSGCYGEVGLAHPIPCLDLVGDWWGPCVPPPLRVGTKNWAFKASAAPTLLLVMPTFIATTIASSLLASGT